MLIEELQRAVSEWRERNPSEDKRNGLYFRLTERMVRAVCASRQQSLPDGPIDYTDLYILGVRTYGVSDGQELWSGVYDADQGVRIAGPFTCDEPVSASETPQDAVDRARVPFGRLSEAQVTELIGWFIDLANATDASQVNRPPDFYTSTSAWLQMNAFGMLDERSDLMPWNMPTHIAQFFSDVWYAQRVAIVVTQQKEKNDILQRMGKGHV